MNRSYVKVSKYICDWLEITMEEFWRVIDGFVNTKLFKKEGLGKYIPKFKVGEDFEE